MKSSFSIRKAQTSDAKALSAFARRAFANTFTHYEASDIEPYLDITFNEAVQHEEIKTTEILLVESAGILIGYAKMGACKLPVEIPHPPAIELHRLYVHEDWSGKGVGRLLMKRFFDYADAQSAETLAVGVWELNDRAQRLYGRNGFTPAGQYLFPVGSHLDLEFILLRPAKPQAVRFPFVAYVSQAIEPWAMERFVAQKQSLPAYFVELKCEAGVIDATVTIVGTPDLQGLAEGLSYEVNRMIASLGDSYQVSFKPVTE